jgi:hypothetical protein
MSVEKEPKAQVWCDKWKAHVANCDGNCNSEGGCVILVPIEEVK